MTRQIQQRKQRPEEVLDEIREMMKNLRRRYVLYYVSKEGGAVDFDEVVENVASWEAGCPSEQVDARCKKSVYSSLYQTHLPLLEERELLWFDRATKTVHPTHKIKNVDIKFASDNFQVDQWLNMYLSLGSASLIGISLQWIGLTVIQNFLTWIPHLIGFSALIILIHLYVHPQSHRSFRNSSPDFMLCYSDNSE